MRIVQLTAGTGNLWCGTCIRDNTLVHALRTLDHQVRMVPLYLPLKTEAPDASREEPVLLGGIATFLADRLPLGQFLPGPLDRLLASRRVLRRVAKRAGMTRPEDLGSTTVATLRGAEGPMGRLVARLANALDTAPRPDVVVLSNALLVGLARPIAQRLGVPIVCTLQGEDGFLDALADPWREKAWAAVAEGARAVDGFVAVSRHHGDLMTRRLGLDPARVSVVHNGIRLDGYRPAQEPPEVPVVGYLAHLCPEKGAHRLVDAYLQLRTRLQDAVVPRLHLAGAASAGDEAYVEGLRHRLDAVGVGDDVQISPNLSPDEKRAFLRELTVLCVPTEREAFGLYVLEALASGVPVVAPRVGGLPEVLDGTGGGLLVDSPAPDDLVDALAELVCDRAKAAALGVAGKAKVLACFDAESMARACASVYEKAIANRVATPAGDDFHAHL